MTKQRIELDDAPAAYSYILTKARLFLKIGEKIYRKQDAFKMSLEDWPEEMLARIRMGMEQICQFRGYSREKPFEGLDVDGFSALMATLHFKTELQALSVDGAKTMDVMHMRHRMSDLRIVLYNRIELPIK